MVKTVIVYWLGVIGIPGKGPNYTEAYNPNRTIGALIESMTKCSLGASNKRIEIYKFAPGNLSKVNPNDPYWSHDTTLSDYLAKMGGWCGSEYLQLIYVIV